MSSWDSEGLWAKGKHFTDIAGENEQSSVEFALFSALGLECLARAALTKVHPALNADPREDVNVLYGFGFNVTAKPKSLPAHSVYLRLEKIIDDFQRTHRELCEFMALQRNAHLHSADLPFDNLSPVKWLPRYYDTVSILNEFLGKTLEDFVGVEAATAATELIKSLDEQVMKNVRTKSAAHAKVWEEKSSQEQAALVQAALSATVHLGWGEVMRECPVCGSNGTLSGSQVKEFQEKYEDEELLVDVQFLASDFKCSACGLHLKGTEEIAHTTLDTHFIETRSTSLHELYEPEHFLEYDNM
ncbi:hypothetical protein GCM10007160_42850 [Litchfieldella qijiaojingensis]|uniref:C2H2-type domain-containing protein n=1 Tax=Litchfieldella qijiaojingensis TaxID=980347 RepID=A0ABQ2ZFL6_9GAMM|nr:hypothetical protein [Halomonas qijiaojingensis]GGY11266.1 hypothetical protein GCM10007160_42850 [Halomonas qijiaojingensis]